MDLLNINKDFDPDIMDSPKAQYVVSYMEEYHPKMVLFLNANDAFYGFLFPYVKRFLNNIFNDTSSGMDRSDATNENLKNICDELKTFSISFLENQNESNSDIHNAFDLDKNPFIDSSL